MFGDKAMSHKAQYSKLFTPPKFLEMPSVSLEILPEGVYFLLNKSTEKGLLPNVHGWLPLPAGTMAQGEIIRKEPVLKALYEIRKKPMSALSVFRFRKKKLIFLRLICRISALKKSEIFWTLKLKKTFLCQPKKQFLIMMLCLVQVIKMG